MFIKMYMYNIIEMSNYITNTADNGTFIFLYKNLLYLSLIEQKLKIQLYSIIKIK